MTQRWCQCRGCPACGAGCRTRYDRRDASGWRCPACQACADHAATQRRARSAATRPSSSARGYGAAYRKARDELVAAAIADADAGHPRPCALCGQPCLASQRLSAEHRVPVRRGGPPDPGNLAIAHLSCNTGWQRSPAAR